SSSFHSRDVLIVVPIPYCYCNRHHLDLHSFPTRRSSDLPARSQGRRGPRDDRSVARRDRRRQGPRQDRADPRARASRSQLPRAGDRKSTRLNSSHLVISYAVFCLKKKKKLVRSKSQRIRTNFLVLTACLDLCVS